MHSGATLLTLLHTHDSVYKLFRYYSSSNCERATFVIQQSHAIKPTCTIQAVTSCFSLSFLNCNDKILQLFWYETLDTTTV